MGTEKEVLLPDIGDFSNVEVIEILVSAGDRVNVEDSLLTLESDKATMEIPSPFSGTVKDLMIRLGDKISEGTLLLTIDTDEAGGEKAQVEVTATSEPPIPAAEELETVQAPVPARSETSAQTGEDASRLPGEKEMSPPPVQGQPTDALEKKAHASPAVRRFARELGVNLRLVPGSGPKGRITKDDVQAFVKKALVEGAPTQARPGVMPLPSAPVVDFARFGEVERRPLSRIKKISGPHLHRSWIGIPHVTQMDEADITDLEEFRKSQKQVAEKRDLRLTLFPFLMKACAAVLTEMPAFNASLSQDGEDLIFKKYLHIGVAVDTPQGLIVPVIRDVDKKGILDLAGELGEMSAKARDGKLLPADLQGGCFSISSLGGIGGTAFTPIINAPEVAVLGVSRGVMKPVWNGSAFQPRLMLPLSLSYDHRVIDGAEAVRFTTRLGQLLSDIRKLVL